MCMSAGNNILNARTFFCQLESCNEKYFYCDFHIFLADFKRHTHPLSGKSPLINMKIDCRCPLNCHPVILNCKIFHIFLADFKLNDYENLDCTASM